jgi:ribosomal protein S18 acetylase RimI-like enzyme
MTEPAHKPADLETVVHEVWARVGTAGLKLRPLRPEDLKEVARALQKGEGYTLAKGERLPTLQTVRRSLANYGVDGIHAGLVASAADGEIKAFLLYVLSDRSSGMFGADNLIMRLPPSAFPPSGRFLQIYDLWVSPEWRQQRVASALKSALEAVARANDLEMIYTLTEATHTAALRLNAGLGYRAIYTGPMWDEVERVALVKWLPLDG